MIVIIDNYDSFTYNLYQYIGEQYPFIEVYRNDEITLNEVTDQIIDISDKYNSAGITSGQLLNLITLTQTDDELLDALSLDKKWFIWYIYTKKS